MTTLDIFRQGVDQNNGLFQAVRYLDQAACLPDIASYKLQSTRCLANGIEKGPVLEIGCGTGADARTLQTSLPGHQVIALDNSFQMTRFARSRDSNNTKCEYLQGDGKTLPFAAITFSGCRLDRTLQHVTNPSELLSEIKRVLRPKGHLVICEPDWETLVVNGGQRSTTRHILNAWCDRRANGWIGRNLTTLLADAGFEITSVDVWNIMLRDIPHADELLQLSAASVHALEKGLISSEEQQIWLRDVLGTINRPDFLAVFNIFMVCGRTQ